jgi:hypothetical protein
MKGLRALGLAAAGGGWRKAAADRVAPAAASRTRFGAVQIRVALGLAFLGMSVKYLVDTLRRFRARA